MVKFLPYEGRNLIHLLAVIGILNWGLELYLRILAVKSDSLLALENKPMLMKKAKKRFLFRNNYIGYILTEIIFNAIKKILRLDLGW